MVQISEFQNPPVKYRIKPFWFWNGEMTKEEISRQIGEMAEKGLGGMFICARQGMDVPYLSKEWFDLVEYACAEAREKGLEAWLYDEYPYPSGMSGGEVLLEHPEAEHMVLDHKCFYVSGGEEIREDLGWSRVLFAKAYPVDQEGRTLWKEALDLKTCVGNLQMEKIYQQTGLTKYNNKRFFTYGPSKILQAELPVREGQTWRIEVYTEKAMGDFKYYGGFFDPCNEKAVETFLETTHERYKQAVGDQFGITVHGMFSDEVGLLSPIPWSKLIPAEFEKRHGYSLLECMPALHDDSVENAMKIRYDLYETAHELFRRSYHKQVSDWCRKNHLKYATEVPSMRHSTQRYSDIVGGDTAHEKLGKSLEWIYDEYIPNYRSNAKAVSSLARQLGKEFAMIESFHSVGWTMTLQDAKWMIDRLGSSGINLYNFHAFYYTIQDITKHDAPPSQFLQNPYWKHYRKLADYVGRMGVIVTNTEADIQIAVLDPVAALWTRLGNPFHGFPYKGESEKEKEECSRIRESWVKICKTLLFHQLDYDHLDAEMLQEGEISQGKICLGKASYSVVIVPPCHCMEAGARKKLEEFAAAGGRIIGVEMLPFLSVDQGETDQETKEEWQKLFDASSARFLPKLEEEKLISLCREQIEERIKTQITEGNPKDMIVCQRWDQEENRYIFAANQGRDQVSLQLLWEKENDCVMKVQKYDLETGEISEVPAQENGLTVKLGAFESQWLKISALEISVLETGESLSDEKLSAVSLEPVCISIPVNGQWKLKPEGKNICRFGEVEMSLDHHTWHQTEVKTFIEQCSALKILEKEAICFAGEFGTPKKMAPSYPIKCWYRMKFQAEYIPEDLQALMDRETAAGTWEMKINGVKVEKDLWKPVLVNDFNNRAADISSLVNLGENTIEIGVVIEKDEEGLRDPFYLMGTFGVTEKEGLLTLTTQPETGTPDGHWCKGFPYYSGAMEYETVMEFAELEAAGSNGAWKEAEISLDFSIPSYDCIEVKINGTSLGVKSYTPYIWKCPKHLLQQKNTVTITVTNTLAHMLDGTYFDYDSHQLVSVKP